MLSETFVYPSVVIILIRLPVVVMNLLAFSNFIQRSLESTSPEDDNLQVSQNLLPLVIFPGEKMNMQRNKSTNFYMHHDSVMNTSNHSGMIDVYNLSSNTHVRSKMCPLFSTSPG
jgi:hypothetical protein